MFKNHYIAFYKYTHCTPRNFVPQEFKIINFFHPKISIFVISKISPWHLIIEMSSSVAVTQSYQPPPNYSSRSIRAAENSVRGRFMVFYDRTPLKIRYNVVIIYFIIQFEKPIDNNLSRPGERDVYVFIF